MIVTPFYLALVILTGAAFNFFWLVIAIVCDLGYNTYMREHYEGEYRRLQARQARGEPAVKPRPILGTDDDW